MEKQKIKVYAFVGPSGTGKSYRAQMVASQNNIHYIIDDGLLIDENEVLAGTSAKKAPTKIETVRHALFIEKDEQDEMRKALKKYKPESLLILGTSDKMIAKIRESLGLPELEKTIYINEIATEEEMESLIEVQKDVRPIEDSPVYEMFKSFGLLRRERKEDRKIRVVLDEGITDTEQYQLFEMFPQLDMGDSSEWIWRSRTGRMVQPDVPFRKCEKDMFEVGDVLIVNNNYQHYAGEIQIVRIPFKNDGQRNYLGHLAEGEELILDLLKNFDEVTFLKAK